VYSTNTLIITTKVALLKWNLLSDHTETILKESEQFDNETADIFIESLNKVYSSNNTNSKFKNKFTWDYDLW
jgi:hypothetical protein